LSRFDGNRITELMVEGNFAELQDVLALMSANDGKSVAASQSVAE
jgi:hypothetical protein